MGRNTGAGCVNCLQKFRAVRWLAERRIGALDLVQGKKSYNKCKWVQERKRHTDTGKLDPERKMAGGKVLVLLPRLQVRQHFSDWPQNHKHAHTHTQPHSCMQKSSQAHTQTQTSTCMHARPRTNVTNTHCVYELSLYYVILSSCHSVWSGSKLLWFVSIGLC